MEIRYYQASLLSGSGYYKDCTQQYPLKKDFNAITWILKLNSKYLM